MYSNSKTSPRKRKKLSEKAKSIFTEVMKTVNKNFTSLSLDNRNINEIIFSGIWKAFTRIEIR